MTTPVEEQPEYPPLPPHTTSRSSDAERTYVGEDAPENGRNYLSTEPTNESQPFSQDVRPTASQAREQEYRLDDDLAMLQAERDVSSAQYLQVNGDSAVARSLSMQKSRSKRSGDHTVDEFDVNTTAVHEKTALYKPPEHPATNFAKFFKRIHESSFLVRYILYISPLVLIFLIPLLLGALLFKNASVGGVKLAWFCIWLEIVWLTLWAGRIIARMIPWPLGLISSLVTNNSKKWRDMGKQLEVPATLFFWWLAVEISFLPTMKNHHADGNKTTKDWEVTMNKIIIAVFTGTTLNFMEKILIQLIAISFHLRTYADRIELNKFQIGSLTKLYQYSKEKIQMEDSDFEDHPQSGGPGSGARTPMQYVQKAQKSAGVAFSKVGDVAGKVAGDFTGKQVKKSSHPHQVVLMLLNSVSGSQVLARRLFRTFVREDSDTVLSDDLKHTFDSDEEADAAFTMFDKDLNGDISMDELEAVCVEIGRERKSITASLKDLDSVVSKLDGILFFIVFVITLLVFISLISTSAAGVLTSAGSAVLALSWLFSATAQEFLQSVIFVFVKHPFDVGDRVSIYGNTGVAMKGDDYFVKEISLLYTEFKKMEGHVVQAPNSYLNTLFILNMRRSGALAEAVPLTVKFGTTLDQIDELRQRLLEFVKEEKREYQGNILTEIRDVVESYSVKLNVIFFYKSNWQNEGLRLQRRNKFICALMVSMQEVGIEGPYLRTPGAKEDRPLYLHYQMPNNTVGQPGDNNSNGPGRRPSLVTRETAFVANTADEASIQRNPTILRPQSVSRAGRARGESVSSMSKRVDFSLGMRDLSSGDIGGDVFDNLDKPRIPNVSIIPASRSPSRRSRIIEEEEPDDHILASTTSHDRESRSVFSLHRASTETPARSRRTLPSVHRNRFFGRRRIDKEGDEGGADQDLMEQGMADIPEHGASGGRIDPRTGFVSPMAMVASGGSGVVGAGGESSGAGRGGPQPHLASGLPSLSDEDLGRPLRRPLGRSHTEDYEMKRYEMKRFGME